MPTEQLATADSAHVVNREIIRFYDKGFDWITTVGPRILLAVAVLFLGLWLIKLVRKKLSNVMSRSEMHSSLKPFIQSLVYTILNVALAFVILQLLGIKLTVFAALIAAFGAAAGLALSGTLQNFASGVLILLLKPFKAGDNIMAQDMEGTVTSIQIFYTVVTTFDNRRVIMPNSKLSNEVIVNLTQEGVRRLDIDLELKYADDIKQVRECLQKVFDDTKEVLTDPKIRIGVSAIEEDTYTITCNLWVNAHGITDTRLMINEKIVVALGELREQSKKEDDK